MRLLSSDWLFPAGPSRNCLVVLGHRIWIWTLVSLVILSSCLDIRVVGRTTSLPLSPVSLVIFFTVSESTHGIPSSQRPDWPATLPSGEKEEGISPKPQAQSSRKPRQFQVLGSALQTMGCLPKFFCGMNSKKPSEKTSTLNDLAYLIRFAMTEEDSSEHLGKDDLWSNEDSSDDRNSYEKMKENKKFEQMAVEELIMDDPTNLQYLWQDMKLKLKNKFKHGKIDDEVFHEMIEELDNEANNKGILGLPKISSIFSGLKSLVRVGRSARYRRPSVSRRPFWDNEDFDNQMTLAARIGTTTKDDKECSSTFNLCPFSMGDMKNMVTGKKDPSQPSWYVNEKGPNKGDLLSHKRPKKPKPTEPPATLPTTQKPDAMSHAIYLMNPNLMDGRRPVPSTSAPITTFSPTVPVRINKFPSSPPLPPVLKPKPVYSFTAEHDDETGYNQLFHDYQKLDSMGLGSWGIDKNPVKNKIPPKTSVSIIKIHKPKNSTLPPQQPTTKQPNVQETESAESESASISSSSEEEQEKWRPKFHTKRPIFMKSHENSRPGILSRPKYKFKTNMKSSRPKPASTSSIETKRPNPTSFFQQGLKTSSNFQNQPNYFKSNQFNRDYSEETSTEAMENDSEGKSTEDDSSEEMISSEEESVSPTIIPLNSSSAGEIYMKIIKLPKTSKYDSLETSIVPTKMSYPSYSDFFSKRPFKVRPQRPLLGYKNRQKSHRYKIHRKPGKSKIPTLTSTESWEEESSEEKEAEKNIRQDHYFSMEENNFDSFETRPIRPNLYNSNSDSMEDESEEEYAFNKNKNKHKDRRPWNRYPTSGESSSQHFTVLSSRPTKKPEHSGFFSSWFSRFGGKNTRRRTKPPISKHQPKPSRPSIFKEPTLARPNIIRYDMQSKESEDNSSPENDEDDDKQLSEDKDEFSQDHPDPALPPVFGSANFYSTTFKPQIKLYENRPQVMNPKTAKPKLPVKIPEPAKKPSNNQHFDASKEPPKSVEKEESSEEKYVSSSESLEEDYNDKDKDSDKKQDESQVENIFEETSLGSDSNFSEKSRIPPPPPPVTGWTLMGVEVSKAPPKSNSSGLKINDDKKSPPTTNLPSALEEKQEKSEEIIESDEILESNENDAGPDSGSNENSGSVESEEGPGNNDDQKTNHQSSESREKEDSSEEKSPTSNSNNNYVDDEFETDNNAEKLHQLSNIQEIAELGKVVRIPAAEPTPRPYLPQVAPVSHVNNQMEVKIPSKPLRVGKDPEGPQQVNSMNKNSSPGASPPRVPNPGSGNRRRRPAANSSNNRNNGNRQSASGESSEESESASGESGEEEPSSEEEEDEILSEEENDSSSSTTAFERKILSTSEEIGQISRNIMKVDPPALHLENPLKSTVPSLTYSKLPYLANSRYKIYPLSPPPVYGRTTQQTSSSRPFMVIKTVAKAGRLANFRSNYNKSNRLSKRRLAPRFIEHLRETYGQDFALPQNNNGSHDNSNNNGTTKPTVYTPIFPVSISTEKPKWSKVPLSKSEFSKIYLESQILAKSEMTDENESKNVQDGKKLSSANNDSNNGASSKEQKPSSMFQFTATLPPIFGKLRFVG